MNFNEQEEAPAPAPAPAQAPAPAPAPAPEVEAEVAEEMPIEEPMAEEAEEEVNPLLKPVMDKLDQLLAALGGEAQEGGDKIEIIDDTEVAETPAVEAPAPAPVSEEITFEVVNNEMDIPEVKLEDDILEIVGDMEEEDEIFEIVGDMEEEDSIDEVKMMGVSHTVQRSTGESAGPESAKKRERIAESKQDNKAQYEAKIAELIKENNSLKREVNEKNEELSKFENGFIKLQENFGEMQDYNAKLVMAYRVAMSGGLTVDEKVQISEQFDKCETVEEAEKLYKSIVNEHKIKVNKNPEKSIRATSIKSAPAAKSVSQPLYESAEVLRMKKLAGIKKV